MCNTSDSISRCSFGGLLTSNVQHRIPFQDVLLEGYSELQCKSQLAAFLDWGKYKKLLGDFKISRVWELV